MKTPGFFVLWNPDGQTPPTKTFDTYDEAARVAETMQKRIGLGTMHILQAVQSISISHQVKWYGYSSPKEKQNVR